MRFSSILLVLLAALLPLQVHCELYEAEDPNVATLFGSAQVGSDAVTEGPSFTGTGYVTGMTGDNDGVAFQVSSPDDETQYNLTFTFRTPNGMKKTKIFLNSVGLGEYALYATASFASLVIRTITLPAGDSELKVTGGWGFWDLDSISLDVLPPQTAPPSGTTSFEAEDGNLQGQAVFATGDNSGYSGRGFINGMTLADDGVKFLIAEDTTAGYDVYYSYRSIYDFKHTVIVVNGESLGEFNLPKTDGNFHTAFVATINLTQGVNEVIFQAGWGYWDLDRVDVYLSTTPAPTTAAPTTAAPTSPATITPSTAAPTAGPTTAAPTSPATSPATSAATTAAATTAAPTTAAPTTAAPVATSAKSPSRSDPFTAADSTVTRAVLSVSARVTTQQATTALSTVMNVSESRIQINGITYQGRKRQTSSKIDFSVTEKAGEKSSYDLIVGLNNLVTSNPTAFTQAGLPSPKLDVVSVVAPTSAPASQQSNNLKSSESTGLVASLAVSMVVVFSFLL
jgi:hypothetical protein